MQGEPFWTLVYMQGRKIKQFTRQAPSLERARVLVWDDIVAIFGRDADMRYVYGGRS